MRIQVFYEENKSFYEQLESEFNLRNSDLRNTNGRATLVV